MHIQAGIPWEPGRRLGAAVNRYMETVSDWALILDWDVSLVNLRWYDICLEHIGRLGPTAGLLSCVTNRIGCPIQRAPGVDTATDDMEYHRRFALDIERAHAGQAEDVTDGRWKLSGLFFLTHRSVWDKIKPAPAGKFIGFDNWYHDRVQEAGYRIYVMRDLYVYHGYRRQWKTDRAGAT